MDPLSKEDNQDNEDAPQDLTQDARSPEEDGLEQFKNAISDELVKKRDGEYATYHDSFVPKWLDYYYDYIGQYRSGQAPTEKWRTNSYFKFTKVKVLSAASQIISAANASTKRVDCRSRDGNKNAETAMASAINDQFEFARMNEKIGISAMDMLLYGTFYMQAPSVVTVNKKTWTNKVNPMLKALSMIPGIPQPPENWQAEYTPLDRPTVYNRNVFEMYPNPYATGPDDGEGLFHCPFISKYELADLRDKKGFDKAAIDELLKLGPSTAGTLKDGVDEKLTARGYTGGSREGYDLIFYAGNLSADVLRKGSVPGFEKAYGYHEVWAWMVKHSTGNYLLKAVPSPMAGKSRPFHSAVFERVPYEAQGVGVCENMKDISALLNGAIRMFIDTKKLALPQIGINETMLAIQGQKLSIAPFKVWRFKGNPKDAMQAITFPDVSDGLMTLIELAERFADEITGIPKWTTGVDNKMLNKTAKGMAMIMNAQGQLMRTAVENIDAVIRSIAEAFYDWNMEFNPDPKIKGDMQIVVNGLSHQMEKDVMVQKLMGMVSMIVNPAILQSPYALKMLRMAGDYAGIKDVDSVLPNPDQLRAAAAPGPGLPPGVSVPPGAQAPQAAAPAQIAQSSGVAQ